jgi:hypothetical protein
MASPLHFASKTFDPEDLAAPEVARAAAKLQSFARALAWRATPFAVNGILKWRFLVREHKLWEYARGLACLESAGALGRVLDFGGAGTLPIFYLAAQGCEVLCLDIDSKLSAFTNELASRRRWPLRASTHDLVTHSAREEWGQFDAVVSFSVLEHIAKAEQPRILKRLACLLRPGGVMAVTFDFGAEAPVEGAVRDAEEVTQLAMATGLEFLSGDGFADSGRRFELDKRFSGKRFTFGSLFLRKSEKSCGAKFRA